VSMESVQKEEAVVADGAIRPFTVEVGRSS
jgi:hypothetical protein